MANAYYVQRAREEINTIRRKLAVRWNNEKCCYEVYTIIHGLKDWRWIKISESTANWYCNNFNLRKDNVK